MPPLLFWLSDLEVCCLFCSFSFYFSIILLARSRIALLSSRFLFLYFARHVTLFIFSISSSLIELFTTICRAMIILRFIILISRAFWSMSTWENILKFFSMNLGSCLAFLVIVRMNYLNLSWQDIFNQFLLLFSWNNIICSFSSCCFLSFSCLLILSMEANGFSLLNTSFSLEVSSELSPSFDGRALPSFFLSAFWISSFYSFNVLAYGIADP